jgi:hypothetical protein
MHCGFANEPCIVLIISDDLVFPTRTWPHFLLTFFSEIAKLLHYQRFRGWLLQPSCTIHYTSTLSNKHDEWTTVHHPLSQGLSVWPWPGQPTTGTYGLLVPFWKVSLPSCFSGPLSNTQVNCEQHQM